MPKQTLLKVRLLNATENSSVQKEDSPKIKASPNIVKTSILSENNSSLKETRIINKDNELRPSEKSFENDSDGEEPSRSKKRKVYFESDSDVSNSPDKMLTKYDHSSTKENQEVHPSEKATDSKEVKVDNIVKEIKTESISDKETDATNKLNTELKADFEPKKAIEKSSKDKCVPYKALASTFEQIEAESGRLRMIEILSNLFRSVGTLSSSDLAKCIDLSLNHLGPVYEGVELGIGESLLVKAISQTCGVSVQKIKSEFQKAGDLGLVALNSKSRQRTMMKAKPLTITTVYKKLKDIANMTGNSSQAKKIDFIVSLMVACEPVEAKFLIRSLQGKLRIGLAEQSVLAALGQAAAMTPFHLLKDSEWSESNFDLSKSMSASVWKEEMDKTISIVKTAFCQKPDFAAVVDGLLTHGPGDLCSYCCITPGIPIRPMLAHPTKGVSEVFKRFDDTSFSCEYKYDGERAQIHVVTSNTVNVYSRNQEDNTKKYPDVIKTMRDIVLPKTLFTQEAADKLKALKLQTKEEADSMVGKMVQSCILDSEAVAWDNEKETILPFQVLSTRKRKDVKESDIKVQVCIYAFDLLYLNGISLVKQSFRDRREFLLSIFPEITGKFTFAKHIDSSNTEEIEVFLEESIKGNCEGLMVKTLDEKSTYEIAKRSHNWLKLKKDYLEGVGDTLDLVPIGAFHGTGKRTGSYGAFLLACYEPGEEQYQTISKLGTGLSDENLKKFYEQLSTTVIPQPRPYYDYNSSLKPDVWFDATCVWEIKAADLSISPAYMAAAGMADTEKGISLRFPRFIRVRDDKKVEDATTADQVYGMFKSQEQIKNQDQNDASELLDYY